MGLKHLGKSNGFITIIVLVGCISPGRASEVALDIGHYIEQPGVVSASGVNEFELNKLLAHKVAEQMEQLGLSHHMIGADGALDVLAERTATARGDRLFLSIHHDSILLEWKPRAIEFSGFSLFVSRKNPSANQSLACAEKIGAKMLAAGFRPSRYHASPVNGENRPFANEQLGIHYYDDLVVLKTALQPAVLIEAGVIVNPLDERKVTSRIGRQNLANALALGAQECLLLLDADAKQGR